MSITLTMNYVKHIIIALAVFALSTKANAQNDSIEIETIDLNNLAIVSTPSPLQFMALISNAKHKFDVKLILPVKSNIDNLTNDEAALALGGCYADLTYMITYNQNTDTQVELLNRLDEKLNLNTFTDDFVARMKNHADNKDSLLIAVMEANEMLEDRLRDEDEDALLAYIQSAEFIQCFYILTSAAMQDDRNKSLRYRVVESKAIVNNYQSCLQQLSGYPTIDSLAIALSQLYELMKDVSVVYTDAGSSTNTNSKTTLINAKTKAKVPPGFIAEVQTKVSEIRAKFLLQ